VSQSLNPRSGRYRASSCGNEASSGSFPAALLHLWDPTQPTSSLSESSECVRVRHRPECEASLRRAARAAFGAVVVIITWIMAVCVPSSVTEGGKNEHAAPVGSPVQPKVTICVEPFSGINT
jgi:hypothetical protein